MASSRDDFVYKHRIEEGLCPYCGTQVRFIEVDPRTKIRRSEPLTVPGVVLGGRCLYCYPEKVSAQLPNDAAIAPSVMAASASASHDQGESAIEPPTQLVAAAVTAAPDDDDDYASSGDFADYLAYTAVPAMEPPTQLFVPAACEAPSDEECSTSDDCTEVQADVAPHKVGAVSPSISDATTPRLGFRRDACRSEVACHRRRNLSGELSPLARSSHSESQRESRRCSDQDDNVVDTSWPSSATVGVDSISSSPSQKRTRHMMERDGAEERSTTSSMVVTPGLRELTEDDSCMEEATEKEKLPSLTIYDEHMQEFKGHILAGNEMRGSGRFEHTHENDYDDLNGNITTYEGEFAGGMFEGMGKIFHARGTVYVGHFENGSPHGFGTCVWPDGWQYVGDWCHDERHGKGRRVQFNIETKEEIENGEQYEGDWYQDEPHGEGELKFNGGGYVKGSFRKGEIHGDAEYHFKDGSVYRGNFVDGLRGGTGRMIYADGTSFEGQWRGNQRRDGTYFRKDGSVFVGTFRNESEYDGIVTFQNGYEKAVVKGKHRNT